MAQRKQLVEAMAGQAVPVAVVSAHPGIRFVVSSLSLMNQKLRAFSPGELPDAMLYLGVSNDFRRAMLGELDSMREKLEDQKKPKRS